MVHYLTTVSNCISLLFLNKPILLAICLKLTVYILLIFGIDDHYVTLIFFIVFREKGVGRERNINLLFHLFMYLFVDSVYALTGDRTIILAYQEDTLTN